ncbi:MAG: phosphatase PAP2 family protein [archaeon]
MVWEIVTELGGLYFFLLVIGLLVWTGQRKRSIGLSGVLLLDSLLIGGLKNFFAVQRPAGATEPSYSFPSAHTSRISALLSFLREEPWYYSLALLVAISRVAMGEHFWQDVVAGLLIGAVEGYVVFSLWKRFPEYKVEKRYRWYLLGGVLALTIFALYISPGFMYSEYSGSLLGLGLGYLTEVKTPRGFDRKRVGIGVAGFLVIAYLAYGTGGTYGFLSHYLLGLWVSFGCEKLDSFIKF